MSVLIKRIDSSSGGVKGYTVGNVTNVGIDNTFINKFIIKWQDPEDTNIGNSVLSTWSKTVLVRKEKTPPINMDDGTMILENIERNKYKDNGYIDDYNIEKGATYYYRFFTLSTENLCNESSTMIYKTETGDYDSVLSNNTWEQIAAASEAGLASSLWNIGDEIDITLSGAYNETVTLQIWDFKHFNKSDGSGKAGICFGMKNLMKDSQQMNSSITNSGGWNDTPMKKTVMWNIYNSMPSNLQSYIKEVNTYANKGDANTMHSAGKLCKDEVFLPGFTEVFGPSVWRDQSITESNQKQFPIFTDDNSIIKKKNNGSGDASPWWTRSPYYNEAGYFCRVSSSGSKGSGFAKSTYGVCFCFNI